MDQREFDELVGAISEEVATKTDRMMHLLEELDRYLQTADRAVRSRLEEVLAAHDVRSGEMFNRLEALRARYALPAPAGHDMPRIARGGPQAAIPNSGDARGGDWGAPADDPLKLYTRSPRRNQ